MTTEKKPTPGNHPGCEPGCDCILCWRWKRGDPVDVTKLPSGGAYPKRMHLATCDCPLCAEEP